MRVVQNGQSCWWKRDGLCYAACKEYALCFIQVTCVILNALLIFYAACISCSMLHVPYILSCMHVLFFAQLYVRHICMLYVSFMVYVASTTRVLCCMNLLCAMCHASLMFYAQLLALHVLCCIHVYVICKFHTLCLIDDKTAREGNISFC